MTTVDYPRFTIETYRPNGALLGRRTFTVSGSLRSELPWAVSCAVRECRDAHGFTPTVRLLEHRGSARVDVTALWGGAWA